MSPTPIDEIISLLLRSLGVIGPVFGILLAALIAIRMIRIWETKGDRQYKLEEDKLLIEKERLKIQKDSEPNNTKVNIDNSGRDSTASDNDNGGFIFFDVENSKKRMFVDALMGFEDYAKLKGYDVTVHINTAVNGKIGMKIVIENFGTTVSRDIVRADARDFVKKIITDDDFSDIPMTSNPEQHQVILSALSLRHELLKQRALINAESAAAYRDILSEVQEFTKSAVTYAKPQNSPYFQIEAKGGNSMGDHINNTNSPGSALGRNITYTGNQVNVGTTATERAHRAKSIDELITSIEQSNIGSEHKSDLIRYLKNIKEEIDGPGEPNKEVIAKWLGRAKSVIEIGGATPSLIEGAKKLFEMFGAGDNFSIITV